MNLFSCPIDHSPLIKHNFSLKCSKCNSEFLIENGVPIFSKSRGYWSNVPKEKMRSVINKSLSTKDWRKTVREELPKYERHIAPLFRGDVQFLFPTNSNSTILDAGSMWGGLSLPIAQFCKKLIAVDKTLESLELLKLRATQEGIANIEVAETPIGKLPFSAETFDHVILNGVLEWLAMDEEIVIESDWTNKKQTKLDYTGKLNPELVQFNGLKELHRVLNKDGSIYIGIENRIGFQYFFGFPDDHVNIPFVSFLPRAISNYITKKIKNHDYRTYLYSPNHLKKMLLKAGFTTVEIYSAFPHYNIISRMVPFSIFDKLGKTSLNGGAPVDKKGLLKVALFSMAWRAIPNPLRKHFCPSISIIASKIKNPIPRIVSMALEKNIISHDNYSAAIVNNRFDDKVSSNIILNNNTTNQIEFYCKVSRIKDGNYLTHEGEMLKELSTKLINSNLKDTIPYLEYHGTIDGIYTLITKYSNSKLIESQVLNGLIKIQQFIAGGIFSPICTKIWLKTYNWSIISALTWLAEFQKDTKEHDLINPLMWSEILKTKIDCLPHKMKSKTLGMYEQIKNVQLGELSNCFQHGDFDLCNIQRDKNGNLFVVDFEHSCNKSLPFFDLGNLLFSSLVIQWKIHNQKLSLKEYVRRCGADKYLKKWLRSYSKNSKVSIKVLEYLPALVAIEQHTKYFPDSRNIHTYPLYGNDVFEEMINWKLVLDY